MGGRFGIEQCSPRAIDDLLTEVEAMCRMQNTIDRSYHKDPGAGLAGSQHSILHASVK